MARTALRVSGTVVARQTKVLWSVRRSTALHVHVHAWGQVAEPLERVAAQLERVIFVDLLEAGVAPVLTALVARVGWTLQRGATRNASEEQCPHIYYSPFSLSNTQWPLALHRTMR